LAARWPCCQFCLTAAWERPQISARWRHGGAEKAHTCFPQGVSPSADTIERNAHMIQADASGHFVLHVDLGLDRIFCLEVDERRGVLTANDPPTVSLPPGDGPRHFSSTPNAHWCYSLQEEGSNIVLFDYDAAEGSWPCVRPSPACRRLRPAATSARRSLFLRCRSSMPAIACMTASESVSVGKNRGADLRLGRNGAGEAIRAASFDPPASSFTLNHGATNGGVFRRGSHTGRLSFTGHYAPVWQSLDHYLLDLAKRWHDAICQIT